MRTFAKTCAASIAMLGFASSANAATVSVNGSIVNLCTIVSSGGTMVVDSSGTVMTTESGVGAQAAGLSVVATGVAPTLTFAAPSLSGPASGAQVQMRYEGSQASQGYTSSGSTAASSLIDSFTIHTQVDSSSGFPSGAYQVTTQVTCGQS